MALVLLVAAGVWFVTGNVPAMLAVLVASCPCALVLAAPATAVAAIAVAARHGILIKGSGFLEQLADVTSVVFDKTGTITTGDLHLAEVRPVGGQRPRSWCAGSPPVSGLPATTRSAGLPPAPCRRSSACRWIHRANSAGSA